MWKRSEKRLRLFDEVRDKAMVVWMRSETVVWMSQRQGYGCVVRSDKKLNVCVDEVRDNAKVVWMRSETMLRLCG